MRKIYAILVLFFVGIQQHVLAQPYCIAPTNTVAITPTGSTQTTGVYNSGAIAFPFAATAGCTYTFSTCGLSGTDTYLRLYDLSNQLVGADDNCGLQSNIVWLCPSSGTYYVFLSRFSCGNLDANTQMSYSVSCPVPPPADPTSITASTNTLCTNALGPVTLTANGASGTVYWFIGSCATSGQFATGNSVVVNPTANTTYYARNYNGTAFSANCASTTVTVINTAPISISGNTNICAGESTTLTVNGGGTDATLANVLAAINTNSAALIASIPTPSGFNMDNGVNGNSIGDGCSDMYDGGNFINTNLASGIFYSDNAVIPSASFGSGGQYFTRYLGPGGCQTGPATLFYMAADVNNLTSLSITGNNGADGQGIQELATFTVSSNGVTYNCYLKRVYNANDPSINQIFMIPQPNGVTQSMGGSTDDNLHALSNLGGVTRVYYMLYAGAFGAFINNAQATAIAQTFADIIPSAANYTWSWSPGGATSDAITVSPGSNTTYTVTGTIGSCTNSASATVNVSAQPAAPTVTASIDPICAGGTTNLNAVGTGQMSYYDAPTGGNLLGTTASGVDFPVSPGTTTTYYVEALPSAPPGSQTFTYNGASQSFVVPAGVTSINVTMSGAAGGFGFPAIHRGGYGGALTGNVAVTPGETLEIRVGGTGGNGTASVPGAGGYNGGGTGALFSGSYSGGGGGGASDIRVSPYGDANRIAVAGGGGGGAFNYGTLDFDRGGGGGGLTGSNGFGGNTQGGQGAGTGGSQAAGGIGGTYSGWCTGFNGTVSIGGNGGPCTNSGGGGGGGYFGGGGGTWAGGGGGSSFLAGATHTQDINNGNGVVTISWSGDGGCASARTPITVTVNPAPTANAGAAIAPICQNATSAPMGGSVGGSATGGTWSGGAGTWNNANDPANATYTAGSSESGSITLTLTTSGGPCGIIAASKTITINVSAAAPTATASLTTICQGGSTNLNATGVGQISWYDAPTGGNLVGTSASGADFSVSPVATTTYYAETTGSSLDSIVYNESFVQSVTPFTQALNWCTFRSNLLNSYGYVSLTIRGSANPTGITITDPIEILNIANAMRTANPYNGTIGGNSWNVSTGCVNGSSPCGGPGVVLHLNTSSCVCDGPGASWVIRPEINNENWGGLGNGNCLAPSQNMEVVFRYNTGSGGCPSPRTPVAITVDVPSVAPASINNTQPSICNGASTQLDVVGGSLSAGAQWEWSDVSCGGAVLGNGASINVTPNGNTTYYVRATAGNTCAASSCASISVSMPAVSTNLSIDGDVATCYVNSGNWIHFYDANARLIASVNSNGQDLGDVTATTLVAANPFIMTSCTQPWDPSWFNAALARSFIITPTTQPTNPVSVRLYILDSEFSDYQTAALGTSGNLNDDVLTITDMDMTKHSGPSEDGNPLNNCGVGSTIYVPQSGSGLTSAVMGGFSGSYYIEYSISSFSEMFPMNSSNSPLPVSLTSFNANCAGDKVHVTWTTASEFNASHYVLQLSRDGATWMNIAQIQAAGTTSQETNYFFEDMMFGGLTYYRLVQVDLDGASEVFGPISSNCNIEMNSMVVYPNPSNDDFTVLIQTMETFENATVELVDLSGRSVSVKEMNILPGSTSIKFETLNIMPGTYIVRIKGENEKFAPIRVVVL